MKNLIITVACFLLTGCASVSYETVKTDGTKTKSHAFTVFSNSTLKGLQVDKETKTTKQAFGIQNGATEPNAEAITASGTALGELIGTAAKSAVKP